MALTITKAIWADTAQRQILASLQDPAARPAFIPCDDRHSLAAYRGHLHQVLRDLLPWADLWIIWLVLLPVVVPLHGAYWLWRRTRPQPGWLVDWENLRLQAVGQKNKGTCQLSPEMGLLAHHGQIEITHPTYGPVLTLFTAAASSDPQDQVAQENLARALAETLKLRPVGFRVQLS